MKLFTSLLVVLLISCNSKNSNEASVKKTQAHVKSMDRAKTNFHKLQKLSVTGDFDGDKKTDTIYQYNFSKREKKEIVFSPSPYKVEWDEVVNWFYDQDSDVTLAMNKKDIVHLGTAQGLYCLINIGDNNKDGKDEVALVIDYCDFSRINSCKIYSLCHGEWELLKVFGIHEGAFDWNKGENRPKFNEIREFLERKNKVWMYKDNDQQEYDTPEEVGQMKVLKVDKCK
jgi:hypothetical protein